MMITYMGKNISCEDGVISISHNKELYDVLKEWLFVNYGYNFGGGSIEGQNVYIGIDAFAGTGRREMACCLKKSFNLNKLVVEGDEIA